MVAAIDHGVDFSLSRSSLFRQTTEAFMKQFLAIYLGSPDSAHESGWDRLDEATRKQREQAGMKAWGDWMVKHQKSIVTTGGPLGKTSECPARGSSP